MAEVLSTGKTLLATNSGSGVSDGKVKVNANDTAGYLIEKIISSNDSLNVTYLADEKALSITTNEDYEAVISPATNFPIMSSNATFQLPTYVAGDADKNGYVNKINLPSGEIASIALFGGQDSSNNKHLYFALYGSDDDDITTAVKLGEAITVSTGFLFELETPVKIIKKKFYWIMWVLTAESNGGDAVNATTTNITGAGVGTWQSKAGIGYISNPFAGSVHFEDEWNYAINYQANTAFVYIQLNIQK